MKNFCHTCDRMVGVHTGSQMRFMAHNYNGSLCAMATKHPMLQVRIRVGDIVTIEKSVGPLFPHLTSRTTAKYVGFVPGNGPVCYAVYMESGLVKTTALYPHSHWRIVDE